MKTMTCAGDGFCRCRICKPPLPLIDRPNSLPSSRLVIGSTGLAVVVLILAIVSAQC